MPEPSTTRFELLEKVGEGGMGEVFRARLLGAAGFQRTVAIKRLLPSLATFPEVIQSFIDEARLLAHLDHPNLVQVFNFERVGGEYLLIMEFVAGASLERILARCRQGGAPLAPVTAAAIAAQAAAGLHYAHTRADEAGRPLGIVHRDVTPPNILIGRDGRVKLTDFGIALAASKNSHTQTGFIMGKIGYLSPEQIEGGLVDARSDLFSLGVILFEMVTARKLFPGAGVGEVLQAVKRWAGLSPRDRPEPVPADLWEVLRAALEPDPDRRFVDAAEMGERLEAFLHASAPEAPAQALAKLVADCAPALSPPSPPPAGATRPVRPARRARIWPWALLLLGAALLAGLTVIGLTLRDRGSCSAADAGAAQTATSPPAPEAAPVDAGRAEAAPDPQAEPSRRPPQPGILILNSEPWAEVEIGGKPVGTTPLKGLELRPGRHQVRLFNSALGRGTEIRVEIRAGKVTKKIVRF